MIDEPRLNDVYRNRKTGMMYRVLDVSFFKVTAVQESPIPEWTWVGDRMDFLIDFVFIFRPDAAHKRA